MDRFMFYVESNVYDRNKVDLMQITDFRNELINEKYNANICRSVNSVTSYGHKVENIHIQYFLYPHDELYSVCASLLSCFYDLDIDPTPFLAMGHWLDWEAMEVAAVAIALGLDISTLTQHKFDEYQMMELAYGFMQKVDISQYANQNMDSEEMRNIRRKLLNEKYSTEQVRILDDEYCCNLPFFFADPNLTADQMWEIEKQFNPRVQDKYLRDIVREYLESKQPAMHELKWRVDYNYETLTIRRNGYILDPVYCEFESSSLYTMHNEDVRAGEELVISSLSDFPIYDTITNEVFCPRDNTITIKMPDTDVYMEFMFSDEGCIYCENDDINQQLHEINMMQKGTSTQINNPSDAIIAMMAGV